MKTLPFTCRDSRGQPAYKIRRPVTCPICPICLVPRSPCASAAPTSQCSQLVRLGASFGLNSHNAWFSRTPHVCLNGNRSKWWCRARSVCGYPQTACGVGIRGSQLRRRQQRGTFWRRHSTIICPSGHFSTHHSNTATRAWASSPTSPLISSRRCR